MSTNQFAQCVDAQRGTLRSGVVDAKRGDNLKRTSITMKIPTQLLLSCGESDKHMEYKEELQSILKSSETFEDFQDQAYELVGANLPGLGLSGMRGAEPLEFEVDDELAKIWEKYCDKKILF